MAPAGTPPLGPVRVVRIQSRLTTGGPARQTLFLSDALRAHGFSTLLVTGRCEPMERDLFSEARAQGVRCVRIGVMHRGIHPFHDLAAVFRLWRLLRRERPHLVHTHTAKAGMLGRIAARLAGVPIVVHTFHGHVFDGYFPRILSRAVVLVERVLARLADRLIVLSPRLRDAVVDRYRIAPASRVTMLPLGLDLHALGEWPLPRGWLRREAGWGTDDRVVGIVGRLAPIKDHALFLESAARLARRAPELHPRFAVIGGGSMAPALEARARELGLGGHVHFFGWRDDLRRVFGDLDLLALTSRNEGTPVAVLEAMAAGVPIAATCVGGVPDLLEDRRSARMTPPGDPAAFAEAMESLLRQPPDEMARAEARRFALAGYSQDSLLANIVTLYDILLSKAGHGGVRSRPAAAETRRAA